MAASLIFVAYYKPMLHTELHGNNGVWFLFSLSFFATVTCQLLLNLAPLYTPANVSDVSDDGNNFIT